MHSTPTNQPHDFTPPQRASTFLAQWAQSPDEAFRQKWSNIVEYQSLEGTRIGRKLMRQFSSWEPAHAIKRLGLRVLGPGSEKWRRMRKYPSVMFASPDGHTFGQLHKRHARHKDSLGPYSYYICTVFEDGMWLVTHDINPVPVEDSQRSQVSGGQGRWSRIGCLIKAASNFTWLNTKRAPCSSRITKTSGWRCSTITPAWSHPRSTGCSGPRSFPCGFSHFLPAP